MDPTTAAGIIGAGAAVFGALAAGGVALGVERLRSDQGTREAHRQELRSACSDFTSAIARVRSSSYRMNVDPDAEKAGLAAMDEARVGCERLRLLVGDKDTQKAARLALRHAYALWAKAGTGVDPRASDYPNTKPDARLRDELTKLYVGVRTELRLDNPADVFEELDN